MKSYEVVNYYCQTEDGLDARDVCYRTLSEPKAYAELGKIAEQLGLELPLDEPGFEFATLGLFMNYYQIEEVEIDG